MAAFVGYCVQANGIHFPWLPYRGFEEGLSPPEQWDAIPAIAKWQFFVYIGILEACGESFEPGQHYMTGGKPGVFPSLKTPSPQMLACKVYPPHGFPLDLFDPFGTVAKLSEEKKERGRRVEINNGRLAMLGIFGFLSEQKARLRSRGGRAEKGTSSQSCPLPAPRNGASSKQVPGAVPLLTGLVKPLPLIEIMGPFVGADGVAHIF